MKTFFYFSVLMSYCFFNNAKAQSLITNAANSKNGYVKIVFNNMINHQPIVLFNSSYTNPFGEQYVITRFKYYVSNTTFYCSGKAYVQKNDYHLVNQAIDSSLSFITGLTENKYDSVSFLLGVDSIRNISGAQTGALDPINDMFWTWNSGYVMEKLEGISPQSNVVNNKMEYHIGGFRGDNSVLNYITLHFPSDKQLVIKKGKKSTLLIDVDVTKFWNSVTEIKINETPVCSLPGAQAKRIAANFSKLFKVSGVINQN